MGARLTEQLEKVGARIRAFFINCLLLVFIFSLLITVPLFFTNFRRILSLAGPKGQDIWYLMVWFGWLVTLLLTAGLILWTTRQRWAAAAGRTGQKALAWLARRFGQSQDEDSQVSTPAPTIPQPTVLPGNGSLPPVEMLGEVIPIEVKPCPEDGQAVVAAMEALGVPGCTVIRSYAGPALKSIQIRSERPASAVCKLADDLAAALGAKSISIGPVVGAPGVLQVDLVTDRVVSVPLRTLAESKAFKAGGILPVALGVDVRGEPLVVDLTETPHLLIGGTTKSGKSGVIRAMITCLTTRFRPGELRLLLIDPKRVEFALWRGLPHLMGPVICTAEEAADGLEGLVTEMLRRYRQLEESGVANIEGYNRRYPSQRMPYIVAIIDEMAQLMESEKEIKERTESAIKQLGQMARACGIHLVLATQSPRATVISGIIRANVPSQIALRTKDNLESRIILDEAGAEKLRGRGDLLYRGSDADQLVRAQGSWVTDELIHALVRWWVARAQSEGATPFVSPVEAPRANSHGGERIAMSTGEHAADTAKLTTEGSTAVATPLSRAEQELERVKELALQEGVLSRRLVERQLGIASERAQDLVKIVEGLGWLGEARGPRPRPVILTPAQRRETLAAMRKCSVAEVVLSEQLLEDADHEQTAAKASPFTLPADDRAIDLQVVAPEIDQATKAAIERQDYGVMQTLANDLARLMRLALERQRPQEYHQLAAARRKLTGALEARPQT